MRQKVALSGMERKEKEERKLCCVFVFVVGSCDICASVLKHVSNGLNKKMEKQD